MKHLLCTAALFTCAATAWAGIPQPVQNVKLAYSQQQATVTFTTDGSAITKAKPLCDCTTLQTQGAKLVATVDTSKFDTTVDKQIDITTADGKTTRVTMHFEVPVYLSLSARSFQWKKGGEPSVQTLTITLPKGSPVTDVTDAGLSGDAFDIVPHVVKKGQQYSVDITPRSTAKKALNRLVLKFDTADARFTQQIIYLQIK